ncbi:MAG: SPFH domain-containing protein [Phycisphaerales bacterium]
MDQRPQDQGRGEGACARRKGTPAGSTSGAPSAGGTGGESSGADESLALLVVEVPLTYRIADLKLYERLSTPQTRESFLRAVARREVVRYLGTLDEEQLLSTGRTEASEQLKKNVSQALADAQTGVDVVFCAIEGVHPPKETAGSYERVVQSQMFAQAEIERANLAASSELITAAGSSQTASGIADELTKLNAMSPGNDAYKAQYQKVQDLVRGAGGRVGSGLAAAQADRWSRHMTQRGLAEAYSGRLAAFRANPSLYFTQRYLETWRRSPRTRASTWLTTATRMCGCRST